MSRYQKNLGDFGEKIAADYLIRQGYQIECENFRCQRGEIDLIASFNNLIVFVEVKTRSSEIYGRPAEAVTLTKRKHMRKSAEFYLYEKRIEPSSRELRFDVIEIYAKNHGGEYIFEKLNHIENVHCGGNGNE